MEHRNGPEKMPILSFFSFYGMEIYVYFFRLFGFTWYCIFKKNLKNATVFRIYKLLENPKAELFFRFGYQLVTKDFGLVTGINLVREKLSLLALFS